MSFFYRSFTLLILCFLFVSNSYASVFFVATNGNDSNPGTIDLPYLTIAKVMTLSGTIFKPGDTLYIRGGVYPIIASLTIAKYGAVDAVYHIYAYPGELPVLDFSSLTGTGNRGISLKGTYCHIKGLEIKGAGDNGMLISSSNNIIENCSFHDNQDSGLQLGSGAANNKIINCDSYYNADPPDYGDADGFACKMDVGKNNYFYGCRAWLNVDDGWDGYLRGTDSVYTIVENCWAFKNGYFKNGADGGANANGNGIKMGGSDNKLLIHDFKVVNCLTFMNKAKGFDQNNNKGSMVLYNCTAYANGANNFSIPSALATGKVAVLKNCSELGKKISLITAAEQVTNSWQLATVAAATDFVSIDTALFAGATAPRKADGSLPDLKFMHIAAGSQLIDSGTDIGLPFYGKAPDMGCFETGAPLGVNESNTRPVFGFELLQNYPNPFNPSTTFQFKIYKPGNVTLKIYNTLGSEIASLVNGYKTAGSYSVMWNANSFASGVYFCQLNTGNENIVIKIVLAK